MIPLKELDYSLNKKGFRDAIRSRYDWEITDAPKICLCGVKFSVNHASHESRITSHESRESARRVHYPAPYRTARLRGRDSKDGL